MERVGLVALSLWISLAVFTAISVSATDVVSRQDAAVHEMEPLAFEEQSFPRARFLYRNKGCRGLNSICRAKDIKKRHCCSGKCVDKLADIRHCGKCGRCCKKGFSCCRGKCVDLKKSKKNCGECGLVCKKPACPKRRKRNCPKATCIAGMCNYGYGSGYYRGYH